MDQLDRAQELDARFLDQALEVQKQVSAFASVTRKTCLDCGENIPKGRREILPGCQRCIDCATECERLRSGL